MMRWVDRVIEGLAIFGVAAYAAAALVTVADIVGRRFGLPVDGVVDIVQLCIMAGAWFVIPWAFVAGAHVSVDFVQARMPETLARMVEILAALMAGALLLLMLRYGYDAAIMQRLLGDRSQQLGIPIIWYWAPQLLGQALAVLAVVSVLIRLFGNRRSEDHP
jgi:TRAP-type C4-dicarboxylate transport system permease small subunit